MDEPKRGRSIKRRRTSSRSRSRSYSRSALYEAKKTAYFSSRRPIRIFPGSTISLPEGRFPSSVNTALNYMQDVNMTSTAGSIATYIFRGNSLTTPNYSGSGHQPYLFDQFMALYTTYVVYGVKVEVTFTTNSTAPLLCVLHPSLTGASSASSVTDAEKGESVHGILGPNGSTPYLKLEKYYDVGKIFGSSKSQILFDIAWQGTSSTDPSALCYLKAVAKPVDGSTTATIYLNWKLKFYCTLRQRIEQTQS